MNEPNVIQKYEKFLQFERNLGERTIKGYLNNLRQVALHAGNLLEVKHRSVIVNAIEILQREKGWDPEASTTWRCSHDICFFYKWACMEGVIPFNPYPFNSFRKPQYHAVEFTNEQDWKKVIENDIHLTHQDKFILWAFWDTGLRREELGLLDQCDFKMSEKLIFLPEDKSKGGYGQRYVAMSRQTHKLAAHQFERLKALKVGPHAFCGENFNRINFDEISARVTRAGRVFSPDGFIKINPRMLRHSVPIRMLEAEASDLSIMVQMGHANKEMTRRYTHSTKSFAKGIQKKYLQNRRTPQEVYA